MGSLYSKVVELPDAPIIDKNSTWQSSDAFTLNGPRIHEYHQEMNKFIRDRVKDGRVLSLITHLDVYKRQGLYWGGFTAVTLAWVIIDLPETTGRTFSEINELFNQGVPARKFASTVVDPFGKGQRQNDSQVDNVIDQSSSAMQQELNEANEF